MTGRLDPNQMGATPEAPKLTALNGRMTRRAFLGGTITVGVFSLSFGSYSCFWEPHRLTVERKDIWLKGLPGGLDGLRLAQLSDIHYGPYLDDAALARVVNAVNELNPDIIVLTGDYVTVPLFGDKSRALRDAISCAQVLGGLQARQGVFAVLGNHDHAADAGLISEALESHHITVLRNRALPVEEDGARLWMAGIDDVLTGAPNLSKALRQVPANEVTVLLAHEPDYADAATRFAVHLQLSGHSHGGQVRLPLLGAPILPSLARKYPAGLWQIGNLQLYTNRGIGVIDPPIRINCPPEITLLTLRSGNLGSASIRA